MAEPSQHPTSPAPRLDFWVTVEVRERDGRFMAAADLGEDSRDLGVGVTTEEAVNAALRSLGESYASELAAAVESEHPGPHP